MSESMREMTLAEWVGKLYPQHRAVREWQALAAERDELQRRVEALEAIREAAENHIPACAVCTTPDECDLHECSFRDWRAAREAVTTTMEEKP